MAAVTYPLADHCCGDSIFLAFLPIRNIFLYSNFCYSDVWKVAFFLNEEQEVPSEKAMALHSSTLAWKIPWTEEPVGCRESDMTNELNNSKGFSGMEDYPKQLYYKENNLFF